MLEVKLTASEDNCHKVTQSATETVETLKDEFDKVVNVLEATEQRLNDTLTLQSSTEVERQKLEIMVENLRRTGRYTRDSTKLEERKLAVMRKQFEQKVR